MALHSAPDSTQHLSFWALINTAWFGLIVAILLAFAGGALAVVLYFKSKATATIRFATADAIVIGPPHQTVADGLEVRFENHVVPRVTTTSIALWNGGRVTIGGEQIVASDPLRVSLEGSGRLLRMSLEGVSREQIGAEASIFDEANGHIRFDFLDPGDAFRLRVIHSGKAKSLKLSGTIRGLPGGLTEQQPSDPFAWIRWPLLVGSLVCVVMLVAEFVRAWASWTWTYRLYAIGAGMLIVLVTWVLRKFDARKPSRKIRGVPDVVTQDNALLNRLRFPFV